MKWSHAKPICILFLSTLVFCLWSQTIKAQDKGGYTIVGNVRSSVAGRRGGAEGIPGATVTLRIGTDSLTTITSPSGDFIFKKVPGGKATLTARHISYQTKTKSLDITSDIGHIGIILDEKMEVIKEARVQAEVPVFSFAGDTLQYNVAATQKVSADETLKDVLLRLPGVTSEDGMIKILGEPLERIYVDKKLLFGENTGAALSYMAADNIVRIKVYDEPTMEDRRKRRKSLRRERAINVETFSKMKFVTVGLASAGVGSTIGADGGEKPRYGAGAAANYFSEKLMLSGTLRLDDLGKNAGIKGYTDISKLGKGEGTDGYAGVQFIKYFGDVVMGKQLSANYSFGYGNNSSASEKESTYNQGERIWTDNTISSAKRKTHNAVVSWMNPGVLSRKVELAFNAAGNDDSWESTSVRKEGDGLFQGIVNGRKMADSYRFDLRGELGGEKWVVSAEGSSGWSSGDYSQDETTTIYSGTTVSTPTGDSQSLSLSPSWFCWSNESSTITIKGKVGFDRHFSHEEKNKDGIPDPASSVLSTFLSNSAEAGVNYYLRKGNWAVTGDAKVLADRVIQDMTLPVKDSPSKGFISPGLFLSAVRNKPGAMQSFVVELTRSLPSSGDLSGYLNTSNPYFIRRGNPDLKQAHSLRLAYSLNLLLGKGYSLMVDTFLRPVLGDICQETYYFRSGETRYGYYFAPGTTLTTFRNANSLSAHAGLTAQGPVPGIKVQANITASYDFSHDQGFLDGELHPSASHSPSIKASLTSNFSRNHKIRFNLTESYRQVNTTGIGTSAYLLSGITLSHKSTFPFGLTLESYYRHQASRTFSGAAPLRQNILNLKVGYKIFRSKNGEVSFSIYDVTGTWAGISMSQGKDFVRTTVETAPWRCWTVNFVYSFNTSRKGGGSGSFRNMPNLGEDYGRARVF